MNTRAAIATAPVKSWRRETGLPAAGSKNPNACLSRAAIDPAPSGRVGASVAATVFNASTRIDARWFSVSISLNPIGSVPPQLRLYQSECRARARIAEIYNRELKNYPAAMLEYEKLLGVRLDAESWGRAALHLAKIYGRLNWPGKAGKLLRRLEVDYRRTLAARRARQKMAELEC
jgi:hypothetical protein